MTVTSGGFSGDSDEYGSGRAEKWRGLHWPAFRLEVNTFCGIVVLFLLLLRLHGAKVFSSVRGYIRQAGSAKLASPISAEVYVVNRRFLSQFRVIGETRSAKLDPPIWLGERGVGHS
jgi:hypothetical protein